MDYAVHIRVRNTNMGDKYYGHTISREVEDIKIEPVAWNSDQESGHPINAVGSKQIISQNRDGVNDGNSVYKNKAVEQQVRDVQAPTRNARNAPPGTTLSNPNIPQSSRAVKESGSAVLQRVEELSKNGEAITVEEAKRASGYGDNGALVLTNAVNHAKGRSFSQVKGDMHLAYLAGRVNKGMKFETDLQREAYYAGKKDAEMGRLTAKKKAGFATVYGEESGFIPNDASKNVSPKMQKALNIVAKDLGLKVMFEDRIFVNSRGDEANAAMGDDGIFRISSASTQPLYELIIHEPFHRMRQFATQEYYEAMNFAVQHAEQLGLRLEQGNGAGTYFEALNNLFSEKGISHNDAKILDELAAQFYQKLVSNDADAVRFIQEMNKTEKSRSALQKFMDFVKDLIAKLQKVVRKLRNQGEYAAAKQLDMTIKELEQARKFYKKAYQATREAVENRRVEQTWNVKGEKNTATEDGVSYLFKESFGKQLEDWRKGNGKAYGSYNGKYFELGTTPDVLVKHGAPEGEVIMFEDCLTKIAGLKHSIGLDEIAKIPTQLNDPILLFKGSHENSFVALTEVKAKNGHDVIVAIHINKRLGRSIINKIASVYSKTDDYGNNKIKNYVMAQISAGNLLDASTKKAPIWFTASGLQLPHAVQTIIDANNSILQTTENSQENFAEHSDNATENSLAKNPTKGYNENGSYSLKDEWHTDLTKAQLKMVDGWLRQAGSPEATRITDTANWYMGRLNGDDVFVIYSNEDAKGPTILYEVKGKKAKFELNALLNYMEEIENGESSVEKSSYVNWVSSSGWMQHTDDITNNVPLNKRGRSDRDARVLQGQSQGNPSRAFWNVLDNLFKKQGERIPFIDYSLTNSGDISPKRTKELLDTIAYLKGQFETTKFAKADPKKLKIMTRKFLKEYSSKLDLDETTATVDDLYRYLANGEDGHPAAWDEAFRRAKEIAVKIAENAVMKDDADWTTYRDLRNYLRTTKIYVNPENFGDAAGFHRRNLGRILVTTTDKSTMGVDEVFQELAELYPEFFNGEKAGSYSDKLYVMEDVLDSLKPLEFNPYANDMELATTSIANDILQKFFEVPQARPTYADKMEQRLAKERIEGAKRVAAQRESTKKLLERARASKEKALATERKKSNARVEKMSENRKAQVLRAQITRSVGRLSRKLVKPSDKNHIPQELQEAVNALLYNINLESNYSYDSNTGTYRKSDGYSYRTLTSKPDMRVSKIGTESPFDADGKLDRRRIVEKGIENVRQKKNPKNTDENAYVYISDIDRNVLVTKDGLRHGLSRNAEATAKVTLNIGDILENSIRVNELVPRKNTIGGYVLLGIAQDENKNYYPVRVVVNQYSAVEEVEALDVLYAVNAKKKNQSSNEAGFTDKSAPLIKGSSVISISNLLELVKDDFSDVMSDDVLKQLGVTRKKSTLAESLRYTGDLLPTKKTEAFRNLKEVYAKIAENNNYGLVLAPELLGDRDYGIGCLFDEVMKLGDKKVADMTLEELTKVYDVVQLVEHSVLTAGKMFALQKWETLKDAGRAFETSTATRRAKHALMKRHFALDLETPLTFFSHFGNAGNELFRVLRNAQDNEQMMQNELADIVGRFVSSEFVKKANKETFEFETMGGEKLTLSKAHIMNLYLLSKREQAKKHLLGAGIHQPEVGKLRRSPESTRLTEMDLGNMFTKLTEEDKKVCENLQKATRLLAKWGNEASMRVFGYEKFKDANYWTIKTAPEGVHQSVEKNKDRPRSIKNMGSAKSVVPEANNSLDIEDVFSVFARHSSDMLCYSAWLEVMEDVNRLYNYKFVDEDGNPTGKTFRSLLEKYAGEGGGKYFFQLMSDIQNGLNSPADTATEKIWAKLYGNAQRAAVAGNLRVVIQQPTAYVRAASVLNTTSLLGALAEGTVLKPTLDGWKKAVRYAPIATRKAIGGYEIGANAQGLTEVLYTPDTFKGKAKKAIEESGFWGAGKADELTWGVIWNACEIETNKNKKFEKGSEEYYRAVAELFTQVIDETQVVDGVLQRSQAMRTSAGLVKQMTAFTGEPTQGANIVIRAYDQLRYETEPAKRAKAIKKLGRAVSAYMLTAITTAFAASLVDALRDDDEEDYWEKVWKHFSGIRGDEKTWFDYVKNIFLQGNLANNMNPLTWIPIAKDLLSMMQGYDVERMDAAVMGDLLDATNEFTKTLNGEGKKTVGYAAWNLLARGAKVFGKSPYNVLRDAEGMIRTFQVETDNLKARYDFEKLRTKPSTNLDTYVDILYKAYETDNEAYEYIYNDMIQSSLEPEKIKSKMESRMKKAEGVEKTEDLSKRYMSPSDERKYDNSLKQIQSSRAWQSANATQKKDAKASLHNFLTSTSESMEEKRAEARSKGVDETEYILWELAKEVVIGGDDSWNAVKKAAAISLIDLGNSELAYFYDTETADKAYTGGVSIENFAKFKAAVSGLKGDGKKAKVLAAAEQYADNYKEWLFFMGSEYSSYKKRSDYISYFGK